MTKVVRVEKLSRVDPESVAEGEYTGIWGGYEVVVDIRGVTYRMGTKDGIRTPHAPCIVKVKNGSINVSVVDEGQ